MMRKIVTFLLLCIFTCCTVQGADQKRTKQLKTDIATAKAALKNAVDMESNDNTAKKKLEALEKSEQTMRTYLSQEEYKDRKDLHLLLIDLLKKQYEAGNAKMYLKIQTDTAWYVRTGMRMFDSMERFDSLDALPNEKGQLVPSYRKRHAEFLAPYRDNIKQGGVYYSAHKQWNEAWQCFDQYLDMRRWSLFESTERDSSNDSQTAYYALLAAIELSDLDKAKKYSAEALTYEPRKEQSLKMLANLCHEKNDTAYYLAYITEGFNSNPQSEYFFPRLIDYYTACADYQQAEAITDKALSVDSANVLFLLSKHSILMTREQYDDAVTYAQKLQSQGDTLSILDYDIAYVYYKKAQGEMKNTKVPYRTRSKNAQKYYRMLLPYMERYREKEPQDRSRWYPILYDAYLNLNMGRQFNALDK